ncbi:MAG TPA: elongation factor P maturation arginine rhamnosyltransferase EarP [Burkholderiales bacterium]|nr:elongation factor P maturation arginine rhamnosyltransferase EarP [Burkholderiales bacterium]
MNIHLLRRWDIFCRVVDNFGDIGVSWRLARQLACEHGLQVRLWVDQLSSLRALCPQVDDGALRQMVNGVEVFLWNDGRDFPPPADTVIEAFGCGLPPRYVDAMAALEIKPLWIVLEYLSAEPWVREHHGLPSPHPQLGLPRYFFFPGFSAGTGGVLREADLPARRDAFNEQTRRACWSRWGFEAVPAKALAVSLFAYSHAPFPALLEVCAKGASAVVMAIPEGPLALCVREHLRCGAVQCTRLQNLEVRFVPFLPQVDYDELLWACDVNFVRGEDSFVRAQWARRPFVWHIYPQAENAHQAKLDAFLNVYGHMLPAPAAHAVRGLWHAWNEADGASLFPDAWQSFINALPAQRAGLRHWQDRLTQTGDMAGNLVKFCQKMI